ncbi:MAG: hypothetical protein H6765_03595 [Candidatus Peribacteria bacterium]|nr:MAG: hypothetical protein H6765_03595 [Candidatus Peribacteria bacterium]
MIPIFVTLFAGNLFSQSQPTPLGDQPGLGSNNFYQVPTSEAFQFTDLDVEYRWFGQDNYAKSEYDTTWHKIEVINFAYDSAFTISAIKFADQWLTMYGESGMYLAEHFDGHHGILVCPTEQPCFVFGIKTDAEADKESLLKQVLALRNEWGKVGHKKGNYRKVE